MDLAFRVLSTTLAELFCHLTFIPIVVAQGSASYPFNASHSCSNRCLFSKWSSMYDRTMWPVEISMLEIASSSDLNEKIAKVTLEDKAS